MAHTKPRNFQLQQDECWSYREEAGGIIVANTPATSSRNIYTLYTFFKIIVLPSRATKFWPFSRNWPFLCQIGCISFGIQPRYGRGQCTEEGRDRGRKRENSFAIQVLCNSNLPSMQLWQVNCALSTGHHSYLMATAVCSYWLDNSGLSRSLFIVIE